MSTIDIPTPELDKVLAAKDESQPIGEFLEWLSEEGFTICEWDDDRERFVPHTRTIEERLGDYFKIDVAEAEAERMRIIEHLRSQP